MTSTRLRSPVALVPPLLGLLALVLAACGGSSGGLDCGCDILPPETTTTETVVSPDARR